MTSETEARLVRLLAELRRERRQQSGLDAELVPADEAAAYRIAGTVAAELGWAVGGWKIAAIKPEMQRAIRTTAPIYGRVFRQFLTESPATLPGPKLLRPITECEYMVRLAADLPPRAAPYTEDEVADAVASVHPGIEAAECRFAHDERFPALPAILADGSGSGTLILGPAIPDWRNADIPGQTIVLTVDGRERRRGTAAEALDHPLMPLTWLANELSRTGVGLHAGEVVSTGTCTGMILARPGETHIADYGPFGSVTVSYSA